MSLATGSSHAASALSPTLLKAPLDDHNMGLSFLWLEITQKCNLECIHCYADSSPHAPLFGRMRKSDWISVIDDAASVGCRAIQFIGGEPTVHPDLNLFIFRARSRGVELIEVYTNATALTKERLNFFRENGVSVATSFYSCRGEVHEK